MSECDEFEIAMERDQVGALASDERGALHDHLKSCASCRAYGAAISATNNSEQMPQSPEWVAMGERIRGQTKRERVQAMAGVALGGVCFSLAGIPLGAIHVAGALVMTLIVGILIWFWLTHARVRLPSAQSSEWIESSRRLQDQKVRETTWYRNALPLLVTVEIGLLISRYDAAAPKLTYWLFLGVGVVIATVALAFDAHFNELPKARRERAELG